MIATLAFLEEPGALDLGRRFARLRWQRAVRPERTVTVAPEGLAEDLISGEQRDGAGGVWMLVADSSAVPVGAPGEPPDPAAGRMFLLAAGSQADGLAADTLTLRELEGSSRAADGRRLSVELDADSHACALCLRPSEQEPRTGETIAAYWARMAARRDFQDRHPGLDAFQFEPGRASGADRPDLSRRLPAGIGIAWLLDVGCGAGESASLLKERMPGLVVTGIESDPETARGARSIVDRVLEGDPLRALACLEEAGEKFDAILVADVLERLENPVAALALARRLARPGATIVARVGNVGHLSIARDLVLGRFDPVSGGLQDARRLRWFDRRLLSELLTEAGWNVLSVEAESGPLPRDAQEFLSHLENWPDLDRESLSARAWVAVAVAGRAGEERSDV